MTLRKFEVTFYDGGEEIDTGIIGIDQSVIDVVDDEWRTYFYQLYTPEEIAAHIAWNMVINNMRLSEIEGWLMPDELAQMIVWPQTDDWEVKAKEIKEIKDG